MKNTLGVMIDCSRNAVFSPSEAKEMMKVLSRMGYSRVLLYTEDTYEVNNEPYFGYLRGRYTKEELKDLDAYAKTVGIELVPCIQTLAHLNAIFHWDEYRQIRDFHDILLADEDRTYQLIENIFATLRECFTTEYINIGMDEANFVGLGRYRMKHGIPDRMELMLRHLHKVCDIAKKYGFKPTMWNDMFIHLAGNNEESYQKAREQLPENVTLAYWDYYRTDVNVYLDNIRKNKKITDRVSFAGGAWCWHGIVPCNEFSIRATKAALTACVQEGIHEILMTMWGDDGHECSKYAVLPTLAWASCLSENPEVDEDTVKAKFNEWTGENYDDFMLLSLANKVGKEIDYTIQNPSKYLLYNDPFLGRFDWTVNEGDAQKYADSAVIIAQAAERSKNYGYVFNSIAKLCDTLSIKADLGVRLRAAYKEGDKETLKSIANNDIPLCIEKLNAFYDAFSYQWHKENKPHGFDVQDIRIGGLNRRLQSCADRLNAYLCGDVAKIEELEETLLPCNTDLEPGKAIGCNNHHFIASVNVMAHHWFY